MPEHTRVESSQSPSFFSKASPEAASGKRRVVPNRGKFRMLDKSAFELIPRSFDQLRCKSTIELLLPCSIEQFRVQLAAELDGFGFGFPPVAATLRGTHLNLWRSQLGRRGPIKLSAELSRHGNQTLLRGYFFIPPIAFVILFCISVFLSLPSYTSGDLVAPLTYMLLFSIGLLTVVRAHAYNQQAFLVDFLRRVGGDVLRM